MPRLLLSLAALAASAVTTVAQPFDPDDFPRTSSGSNSTYDDLYLMNRVNQAMISYALLVLLTLAGCDTQSPPSQDTGGEVFFLLDGQEWAVGANVSLTYIEGYGYSILTSWPAPADGRLDQGLRFALPDLSAKAYPLANYQTDDGGYGASFSELDYDAPLASYKSVGDGDSLVVTRYDPATGEIEATFEGTFATNPNPRLRQTLPDTFEVTRGVVRATLWNRPETP